MTLLLRRRNLIIEALQDGGVATQEELVSFLAESGVRATQGTVSRDLNALGAVKTPAGYRLAEDLAGVGVDPRERLAEALAGHAIAIRPAASIVVIATAPGHSGVVASAVDAADLEAVVGVVAGDDTIFLACESGAAAEARATELTDLASGVTPQA